MSYELISLLVLQIVNLFIASFSPCISNFFQNIRHSECCGSQIDRKVKRDNLSNRNKVENEYEMEITIEK